ncbi:MAG: hypothetical protein EF812_02180 [Methanosarcinales archaeon]|nr:MAG: hypothetical protein EF812_02180 [Methanosarcinales archaeon]
MKTKTITGILIVALVALFAGIAAAQYGHGGGICSAKYMDTNGDGICDNIGTCMNFVDEDYDGVCDNLGNCGCGCGGMNFTDEDYDGVCDNIGTNGRDSDGDGIPNGQDDDYEPLQDRNGRGNGRQGKELNR